MNRDTLIRVYNKYLVDLLRVAKRTSPELTSHLRSAGHKAIDPCADVHIRFASNQLQSPGGGAGNAKSTLRRELTVLEVSDLLENATVLAFEPLSGVCFRQFLSADPSSSETSDAVAYLYILATLAIAFDEQDDALSTSVLNVLSRAQAGNADPDADLLQTIDGILDEDIVILLEKIATIYRSTGDDGGASGKEGAVPDIEALLAGSKLNDIAQEVSREIGSDLTGLDPSTMTIDSLLDGNSPLGGIVGKIGRTIQTKLDKGELDHGALFREALTLMSGMTPQGGGGGPGGLPGLPDLSKLFAQLAPTPPQQPTRSRQR